jgi:hypothetical protein
MIKNTVPYIAGAIGTVFASVSLGLMLYKGVEVTLESITGILVVASILSAGVGNLFSRAHNVTSEQEGLKDDPPSR